jgi:hypothetical protein
MAEERLKELKVDLPEVKPPIGSFIYAVRSGNQLWISGQVPKQGDQVLFKGKVGRDISVEQGQLAAKQCVLNALTHIKNELGSLGKLI